MKITKQRLREIIREELNRLAIEDLEAATNPLDPHAGGRKPTPAGLQGIFDEAGLTPEEVIEVQSVLSGDETNWMNTQSYEKLYQYYAFGGGGMPYGVAKARDGDPVYWILDQLEELEETL